MWLWLLLLLLVRLLLLLLVLVLLLVFFFLLLLFGGRGEINGFLIRPCWPDRTCGGDRDVPGIDFWGRLGCPSRWWSG